MNFKILSFVILFVTCRAFAQPNPENFTVEKLIQHTPVISQGGTGTCWSFATASFLESEITRKGFSETDLSEMFFVYHTYLHKAKQYLLYHGKGNFTVGGQAHDVLNALKSAGMVTNDTFPGKKTNERYEDRELINELNVEITRLNRERNNFNVTNLKTIEEILNKHIGDLPKNVKTETGHFSPEEFRDKFGINPDDYIELTSYTHHPFYKPFVLEIPDNWSNDLYYNLPIDELMEVMVYSIKNGFTFCWDGDTSESTFSHRNGIADLPEELIGKTTQHSRQETFYNRTTTDDHLMHVVGLSKDAKGRTSFYTKNSWGESSNNFGGYLHLTEDYVRLKTIAILVHKDSIPRHIKTKLGL